MKKKIILSLLALVFCLPMMFAVTACGNDPIANIVAETGNKYFIGQDFKSNCEVVATYESGKTEVVEEYTFTGFDNTTAGIQLVTVVYKSKTTQVLTEVLSDQEYFTYVYEKLGSGVESTNASGTLETEPQATLNFDLGVFEMTAGLNLVVNDGNMWYHKAAEIGLLPREYWLDYATHTLYIYDGESYTKQVFASNYEAMKKVVDNESVEVPESEADYASGALQYGYSKEATYSLYVKYADLANQEISLIDDILKVDFGSQCYAKIDYSTWTLVELVPTPGLTYNFASDAVVPAIPSVDWTVVA